MVVVAILGVLAIMAGTFMAYGTGRARMNNSAFEVASLLSVAQMRASSTGVPHYAVFYQTGTAPGTPAGVYLLQRADNDPIGAIDWATVDISNELANVGGMVRDRVNLTASDTAAVDFAELDPAKLPFATLPAPFAAIPLSKGAATSPLSRACSFCVSSTGGTRGVVRFNPDGTTQMLTGGSQAGGVVALTPSTEQQRNILTRFVIISAPAGVFRVF